MGIEREEWQQLWSETPKLRLLAVKAVISPDRPGLITPPVHISAAIPFEWEEEPGKPRFSLSLNRSESTDQKKKKGLELPPRLLLMDSNSKVAPSSVEMVAGRGRCGCGSFRYEKKQLGAMVLRKRPGVVEFERELFGWFSLRLGLREKTEVGSGSGYGSVFPSSMERESDDSETEDDSSTSRMKLNRIQRKRKAAFSCLPQPNSHFWGIIHEGLKHINIPWKNKNKHHKE